MRKHCVQCTLCPPSSDSSVRLASSPLSTECDDAEETEQTGLHAESQDDIEPTRAHRGRHEHARSLARWLGQAD